jgi:hypothetical protein
MQTIKKVHFLSSWNKFPKQHTSLLDNLLNNCWMTETCPEGFKIGQNCTCIKSTSRPQEAETQNLLL